MVVVLGEIQHQFQMLNLLFNNLFCPQAYVNMYVCHLLLWRPSLPYNWRSLELFQLMRLSPDFLLNFPGCTAAPVSAVAVMFGPSKPKERKTNQKRAIY